MGARYLIAVMVDGEYKVAQYGQWDGYPDGQGLDALAFLRSCDHEAFAKRVRACHYASGGELEALAKPHGTNWPRALPHLSSDAGAEILGMIADAPSGLALRNSIDFAGNSLMCEWAYVVDLDKGTFEAFKGFNQKPLDASERFANAPTSEPIPNRDYRYYQIKHVCSWKLDDLPSDDAFLAALKRDEDEDGE